MQIVNQEQIHYDDQLNLRDLVRALIKRKRIILLITITVFLIALAYSLLLSPVYKAQVSFLPPTEADVSKLNVTDVTNIANATAIYAIFEKHLNSLKIRRKIFDKLELLDFYGSNTTEDSSVETIFEKFNKNISIEKPIIYRIEETVIPTLDLILLGKDPKLIAKILNELEAEARSAAKQEVITDLVEKINLKKEALQRVIHQLRNTAEKQKNDQITQLLETDAIAWQDLNDQIKTLRSSAKTKREDRIQIVTEAAKIAESLKLADRSPLLDINVTAISDSAKDAFYNKLSTQTQNLLYLRGFKALRSEIKELTSRTSDDPFIPELRDLQDRLELLKNNPKINALKARKNNDSFIEQLRKRESELALLEAVNIVPNQIRVATVDQLAFPPTKHEKPNRFIIVALGAVLGLFLGIITAFLLNFWEGIREEDRQLTKRT